jgi:hypothetical protein
VCGSVRETPSFTVAQAGGVTPLAGDQHVGPASTQGLAEILLGHTPAAALGGVEVVDAGVDRSIDHLFGLLGVDPHPEVVTAQSDDGNLQLAEWAILQAENLVVVAALIAALAAETELLILDEPTAGLDPIMEHTFQECVHEARDRGCTVWLSSHILAEVEALADRVTIIRRGRTAATGTLADLRRHTRTSVHAVTIDEPIGLDDSIDVADRAVQRLDGYVDSRFTIGAEHLDTAIGRLHTARIHTLTVNPPSLNALFLRSYGDRADELEPIGGSTP